jgi:hypothetical protein
LLRIALARAFRCRRTLGGDGEGLLPQASILFGNGRIRVCDLCCCVELRFEVTDALDGSRERHDGQQTGRNAQEAP